MSNYVIFHFSGRQGKVTAATVAAQRREQARANLWQIITNARITDTYAASALHYIASSITIFCKDDARMKSSIISLIAIAATAVLLAGCAADGAQRQDTSSCSSKPEEATTGSRIPHRAGCNAPAGASQT